jgi:acyl carrier protein phosphodiesterase
MKNRCLRLTIRLRRQRSLASRYPVPAFLEYAKGEAAALINDHPGVVMAIADAMVEHGILTGEQVDAVIERAIAREDLNIEIARRARWRAVEVSAADFAAGLES